MSQTSITENDTDDKIAERAEEVVEDVMESQDEDRQIYDERDIDDAGSGGGTFAGAALRLLILVIVIFGLSLWLVPMAAPYLPANVAKHIMPGQQQLDARLAKLEETVGNRADAAVADVAALQTTIASLTERLAAAEAAVEAAKKEAAAAQTAAADSAKAAQTSSVAEDVVSAAETSAADAAKAAETATTAATEAGKVAAQATRDTASLARQMTSFEARLGALGQELGALGESLAGQPAADGGASNEQLAAFAALKARMDGLAARLDGDNKPLTSAEADRFATQDDLRSARTAVTAELKTQLDRLPAPEAIVTTKALDQFRTAVDGKIGDLAGRMDIAEKTVKDAVTSATAASEASGKAIGDVKAAIKDASLRSAIAALSSRMANGAGFAGALEEIANLTGNAAPEALANAADGVATDDGLIRGFSRTAQAAIAADIRNDAESGGVFGQASARLRSVVAGRPKSEQEGDDAGAILSRVEARLKKGELADALAEAEGLSDAAKAALGDWMSDLRERVTADAAAAEYIAAAGAEQG